MSQSIIPLLSNKYTYCVKYFIKDIEQITKLSVCNISVYKLGLTRRMIIEFNVSNKFEYFKLKKTLINEPNFLNGSFKNKKYCANFVADKKYNLTLDLVIDTKNINCISNDKVFEFVKTL